MTTATAPAPPTLCACERVYRTVLADYVRRLHRLPTGYRGVIRHRCGRGSTPAPIQPPGSGR